MKIASKIRRKTRITIFTNVVTAISAFFILSSEFQQVFEITPSVAEPSVENSVEREED